MALHRRRTQVRVTATSTVTSQARPRLFRARLHETGRWDLAYLDVRKGTNGVSTNGVTANFMFFDRDLLCTPVNLLLYSQSARAYLFPQSVKNHYFCSGPLVLTPFVRNQDMA